MTQTAKQLIAQAKSENWKRLDLGKCGLTDLATQVPELFTLTDLEELVLSNEWWEWNEVKQKWEEKKSTNIGTPNKIDQLPEALDKLRKLRVFICRGEWEERWDIKDINPLSGLTNLTRLDLQLNRLTDVSGLSNLAALTTLYLSYNKLTDVSALSNLPALTTLDLQGNKLTDVSSLSNLAALTTLYLNNNQLRDISPLSSLTVLTKLWLYENKLTDISPLSGLTALTELHLGNNQLTDISPLSSLTVLTKLWLYENKLTDVSLLSDLRALIGLDISNNRLTDVLPLSGLTALTKLWLYENKLTDVSALSNLVALTELNLGNNQLTDISPLSGLTNLTTLDLSYNQLTDISVLSGLTNLTELYLHSNQLADISTIVGIMPQLKVLMLFDNPITSLQPLLPVLQNGKLLHYVKDFDDVFKKRYVERLEGIFWGNNPFQTPPLEVVEQGREAVLRYFERKQYGAKELLLYEAKIVLVGEGGVGKTSLNCKLRDCKAKLPPSNARTRGIDVATYSFNYNGQEYTCYIWDFGGQDIYYSLHRFFLTNNAVYIVMARSRDNDHKFDYWLPNIRLFAGEDNPIVAVYNLFKGFQNSAFSIDEYKKSFNLSPRLFSINLSKINDDSALRDLVTELHHRISQLSHINKPIWDNWLEVRNHLNSLVKKSVFEISHDKFADICRQYDVKEAEITDLGRYLHNLGVLLWYHDKPLLKNMVVLQPTWVTKAIYRLIDDKRIAKNNGHFSPIDTDRLWKGEEYANRKDELLLLAVQFKLCYEQRDLPNHYIIPARLSANMPPIAEAWNDKEGIYIEYRYEFMPHGLVNQLTAVQHKHLDNDSHAWSKGVVLHHLRTVAKVCVKEDTIRRTISVSVAPSKEATSLMAIIMDSMDDLHRDFQGIAVSIVIPCSCTKCKGMDYRKATVFDYDKLRQWYKEDSRKQVTCNESNTTFMAYELLEGIGQGMSSKEAERRKMGIIGMKEIEEAEVIERKGLKDHYRKLMQEEFVTIPKNLQTTKQAIEQAIALIIRQEFRQAFEILDTLDLQNPLYNQLKREYTSGVFKTDTHYADRLTAFLKDLR